MVDKLVKDILQKIIKEFNKDENKCLIQNDIFNPLLYQLKPHINFYIVLFIICWFSLFSLNLLLVFIVLYNNKKSV